MPSAWPVPTATTRTSTPLFFVYAGSRCLNRPDCSVEVVEATVMNFGCAWAPMLSSAASAAGNARVSIFLISMTSLL